MTRGCIRFVKSVIGDWRKFVTILHQHIPPACRRCRGNWTGTSLRFLMGDIILHVCLCLCGHCHCAVFLCVVLSVRVLWAVVDVLTTADFVDFGAFEAIVADEDGNDWKQYNKGYHKPDYDGSGGGLGCRTCDNVICLSYTSPQCDLQQSNIDNILTKTI